MINTFRKARVGLKREVGAATLLMSVMLTTVIAIIVIAGANYTWYSQKISSNQYRGTTAYEAAQAGLEFAIPYFNENKSTITASTTGGFIDPYSDANTSATLSNGSSYVITYTNPVANNYDLILVSVTGTSDDGSSTKTVSELIQRRSVLVTTPNVSIMAKGNVDLTGNVTLTNTETDQNLHTGGSVTFGGSSESVTSGGVESNSSGTGSDVTESDGGVASQSEEFFNSYFGMSTSAFKAMADSTYSGSGNTNYNSDLDGKTNEIIWVDQTSGEARLSSSTQVGTAADPVILVIDGNLNLSGSVKIYGVLVVLGSSTTDVMGNIEIHGSVISTGDMDLKGNADIFYESAIFTEIGNEMSQVGRVSGSWHDF